MTGYGKGVSGNFQVEVRSSNHRNLYIQTNVPPYLYYFEPEIRSLIKKMFQRGRFDIFTSKTGEDEIKLKVNIPLAKEYYHALLSLKKELSIPDDIGMDILASRPEIFEIEESEVEVMAFQKALLEALNELKNMRVEEGKYLVDDITRRLNFLKTHLAGIEEKRAEFILNAKDVLADKLKALLENVLTDESRIIQEAAILIERSDITEEIVRLKSHFKHFGNVFNGSDIIGKKIDFLAQEMHREINTIGAKAANTEISALIIEMKHELEKIREQTQNLQ